MKPGKSGRKTGIGERSGYTSVYIIVWISIHLDQRGFLDSVLEIFSSVICTLSNQIEIVRAAYEELGVTSLMFNIRSW